MQQVVSVLDETAVSAAQVEGGRHGFVAHPSTTFTFCTTRSPPQTRTFGAQIPGTASKHQWQQASSYRSRGNFLQYWRRTCLTGLLGLRPWSPRGSTSCPIPASSPAVQTYASTGVQNSERMWPSTSRRPPSTSLGTRRRRVRDRYRNAFTLAVGRRRGGSRWGRRRRWLDGGRR